MRLPIVAALAAALLVAIVAAAMALGRRRRHQRGLALLADDRDFEPMFPDGPDDRPVRGTVTGRRMAGR